MSNENDRKATGNAGANSEDVEQRDLGPDAAEKRPDMSRRGDRHAAGADTPAGPNPRSTTESAKREREKQKEIDARDKEREESKEPD